MIRSEEVFQKRNKQSMLHDIEYPEYYIDDEQLESLKTFCQSFDPYSEMDLETKLRLQEFGITELSDPFQITNKILKLLENNIQYRESL
jgi:hypothetical protein